MTFALFCAIVFAFVNCISTVPNEVQNYVENAISSEMQLNKLAQFAIEWAHNNGLILRMKQCIDRSDVAEFAPVSLFPSPFPREAFEKVIAAQEAMQLLYFRVARDFDFLFDAYQEVVNTDDHIRQMVDILREVQRQGIKQPTTLLLMRADYMLNRVKSKNEKENDQYDIRQIEVNSGAIGGMGIDHRTTELHRQMLRRVGMDTTNAPQNDGHLNLAKSLFMAWRAFGNSEALLVILCHEAFRYKFELRNLECDLDRLSAGNLRVEYVSLPAGHRDLTLADDFSLLLNGKIVSVVYSLISALGYVPNNALDEQQMEVRKRIELSTAIKAPSLAIAISSSKKIQQLLALPGTVERFFPTPEEADKVRIIRDTFADLWGLENDDEETERIINDAIENPSNYVLKPNGECGGNNYYDEALAQKLRTISPEGRSTHILMQKLHPMTTKNYFLRPFYKPRFGVVVGELGVYGTLLGNMRDGTVSHNVQSGHLLRTKLADVNEGGISVGTGVGDSPYLF